MDALRIYTTIAADGELHVTNLPLKRGQRIEVLVLSDESPTPPSTLTARALRDSALIGLWAERTDLPESTTYARTLRTAVEQRDMEHP